MTESREAAMARLMSAASPDGKLVALHLHHLADVLTELLVEVRSLTADLSRPSVSCGGCGSPTREAGGVCPSCRQPARRASWRTVIGPIHRDDVPMSGEPS